MKDQQQISLLQCDQDWQIRPIKYSSKQVLEKDLLRLASACKHQKADDKQNLQDKIADHLEKKNKSVGDLGLFSERSDSHRLRERSISPIRYADRDVSNYHFNDSYIVCDLCNITA